MEAAIFVYLASVFDQLKDVFIFLGVLASFGLVAPVFWYAAAQDYSSPKEQIEESRKKAVRLGKMLIVLFAVSWLLSAIIPKEKTMYLMAGAYIGQQAITSEVSKDVQDIIGLKIKQYKQELEGDK